MRTCDSEEKVSSNSMVMMSNGGDKIQEEGGMIAILVHRAFKKRENYKNKNNKSTTSITITTTHTTAKTTIITNLSYY